MEKNIRKQVTEKLFNNDITKNARVVYEGVGIAEIVSRVDEFELLLIYDEKAKRNRNVFARELSLNSKWISIF
jgi:hypothetical protein